MIRFSILVVALNAGTDLLKTLESIKTQNYLEYEVVIKDGGSREKSVTLRENYLRKEVVFAQKIKVIEKKDSGIYDAMNQAIEYAGGEFIIFLNCGDQFYNCNVLQKVDAFIKKKNAEGLFYGDVCHALTGDIAVANPNFTPFASYRNMPCHQTCFYHQALFYKKKYDTRYKVRADYEHFLSIVFDQSVQLSHMPITVATYQGGGFSETKENRKKAMKEHATISKKYYSSVQLFFYKAFMVFTLAKLRRKLAESKRFAAFYQKVVRGLYRNR